MLLFAAETETEAARVKFWLPLVLVLVALAAQPVLAADPAEPPPADGWMTDVDAAFGRYVVAPIKAVLFYDFGSGRWLGASIPFVLFWLMAGAVFFTIQMRFIAFRAFWHSVRLTKGDYDDPHDAGEVSHFQALSSALSGTLGLGNIGGVAIAIATGGPGAIVWLNIAGLLGMSSKFAECSLAQFYRRIDESGVVAGGPMYYLRDGLAELGLRRTGAVLAALFAVMCMGGAVGGGCAFQVGQSLGAIRQQIKLFDDYPWLYGLILVVLVGTVIVGGIRRIASAAERIVPGMCILYILCAFVIIALNVNRLDDAIREIVAGALKPQAIYGGALGVMIAGVRRAAFSNEAGIGSAAIAHSAARTNIPIREGLVALLEPFIDTVVVCSITGIVIVITGVYSDPTYAKLPGAEQGAALTSAAFATVAGWFPWLLSLIIFLFAYSTMISWSYYGERSWAYLFGRRTSVVFNLIFLGFVMLGSIVTAANVLDFSDLMIFSMSIPNLIGVVLLSPKVRRALDDYWTRYKSGEFEKS